MEFTEKLGLSAPQDLSARMDLTDSAGHIVRDAEGEPGWIEFWGPDSEPVRHFRRSIETAAFIENKRESRRPSKVPTEAEAERELDKIDGQLIEGLSIRVKAWRLLNIDGKEVDVPPTPENVRQLFSAPDYRFLHTAAINFLGDSENFT